MAKKKAKMMAMETMAPFQYKPPSHAEQKRMAAEHAARQMVESHPMHTKKIKAVKNVILSAVNRSMRKGAGG